jgi:hypothetical protein
VIHAVRDIRSNERAVVLQDCDDAERLLDILERIAQESDMSENRSFSDMSLEPQLATKWDRPLAAD